MGEGLGRMKSTTLTLLLSLQGEDALLELAADKIYLGFVNLLFLL